jgi:Phosphatidylinositol 3- and 4-kinase/Phosphoinositide 3-kinase family, accessory domain (PIK domain)
MNLDIFPLPDLFSGEPLPVEFILYYLYKHDSPGVQAFLINKLYQASIKDISFYLPQLLRMAAQREDYGAYTKFFMDISAKNYIFGMKLYWIIQAELGKENSCNKLQDISHSLEKIIVQGENHQTPLFNLTITCDIEDFSTIRAEYFTGQFKFAYTLVKISIMLINEVEDKESTLKAYIQHLDSWLKDTRFWYNRDNSMYTRQMFRGFILPLDLTDSIDQIVRIPSEEAKVFKTKERVPYKVILETVKITEIDPNSDVFEVSNKPPEDFLDNISINSESILDKDSLRFQGLQDYAYRSFDVDFEISSNFSNDDPDDENPWGESWEATKARLQKYSPFGSFKTWNAKAVIVKGHDDLRQELLAMQIIKKSKELLDQEKISVYLRPYDILIVSNNSGIIECVPDAVSLHAVKKSMKNNLSLKEFFKKNWGNKFEEAQKNFVESAAGYSLLCYILNLKDRHNGNILLDSDGHIIHIDFGFFLTNSPGKLNIESAPFKLTKEMIDLMGGYEGEMFNYYKVLIYQAFLVLRKFSGEFSLLLEMMLPGETLPCFYDPSRVVREFKSRFCLHLNDEACLEMIKQLIASSAENWRTDQYDVYQWVTNGILY